MRWWARYLNWRLRNTGSVVLSNTGFQLVYRGISSVAWDEIDRVTAFKRDLMTTDLLCLAFEADGKMIAIDEDMAGYKEVEQAMTDRLSIPEDWKLRVLFPAFELCAETIFDRTAAACR